MDPTHSEEAVMDGRLVVGVNIHREICALQMAGGVAILPEQVKGKTNLTRDTCIIGYWEACIGSESEKSQNDHI